MILINKYIFKIAVLKLFFLTSFFREGYRGRFIKNILGKYGVIWRQWDSWIFGIFSFATGQGVYVGIFMI